MALNPAFVGRSYPPSPPYEVSREKIREFADAVGDPNPVYRDPQAAGAQGYPGVIAPPTFPIVLSYQAAGAAITDPELGLDFSRVVHGEQRFAYQRPIVAGDVLTVTTVIEAIRSVAGNDLITLRGDLATLDGEIVCSSYTMLVARGVEDGTEASA